MTYRFGRLPLAAVVSLYLLSAAALADDANDPGIQDCFKKMSKLGMPVPPPEEGPSKVEPKGSTLVISGPITKETLEKFKKFDLNKFINIELNSYGGDVDSGIAIARAIRAAKKNTILGEKAICGSICTVIFQGGVHRMMHQRSILGYHAAKCLAAPMFKPIAQVCGDNATEKAREALEELNLSVHMSRLLHDIPFESAKCITDSEAANLNANNMNGSMLDGISDAHGAKGEIKYKKPTGNMLDDLPGQGAK